MTTSLLIEKPERLVFIPLTHEENQMSTRFKKLAIQDKTTQHDLLLEAIQLLFVKHHLDLGGNPQRQLHSFDNTPPTPKCTCGREATKEGYQVKTMTKRFFCERCFTETPLRYDQKIWRFTPIDLQISAKKELPT